MDNLRRQIQHLQEHLECYEASEHDAPPHGSDVEGSIKNVREKNTQHDMINK